PWTAGITCNLGLLQERRGDLHTALATFERCRDGNERIMGREHPEYARALENLGRLQRELGRLDEARTSLDEGFALRRRLLGDDSGETTWAVLELADLDRDAGRLAAAKTRYLAVIEAFAGDDGDETGLARARFGLARVRWQLEGPSAEVRELAESARALLAKNSDQTHHVRAADAWLAEHPSSR
ncbi:MAG TPA: tetratricopeptide repeat protein, partial [Nannocystaceae bacterium]|nr:tetratricopeptide repeat protein [Nannocystaceae bacterium]